jgi:pimeloyl-ACP methyl ester carboxylesterase
VAQEGAPLAKQAQQKLVTDYLAADGRTSDGARKRGRILAELEAVPELTEAEARQWRADLVKLVGRGRKLPRKSGRHFFWDEPERGLYLIGGEVARPKGLLIGFHGGGAGAGDAWSSHGFLDVAARKLDWLAIYPEVLEKTERGWTDAGTEEFVLDLVAAARRTWKLDPDRVFFSGHSMGGYATWTLGAHHADLVAALAPSAGGPTILLSKDREAVGIVDGIVPSLRNVPMVVYQSDDDPQVTPEANRMAAKLVAEAREKWGGYDFEYWEVPRRGHAPPPGGSRALLGKIEKQVRNPTPDRVVWQPALAWKRQFYWLYWHDPVIGAVVVADVDKSANAVHVTCDRDAKGLEVLLDERLLDCKREVAVTLDAREVFRGVPRRSLGALLLTSAGNDPGLVFAHRIPLAR